MIIKKENADSVKSANKLMHRFQLIIIPFLFLIMSHQSFAQISVRGGNDLEIDYSNPRTFEIGGITVSGTKSLDPNAVALLTSLSIGQQIKVPGDELTSAIKNLWAQGLFSDIQVSFTNIIGNRIFLDFYVEEQPRLSRFRLEGVSKSEADDIREKINFYKEKIVTKNLLLSTKSVIENFFVEKGYLYTNVDIIQKADTLFKNHVMLVIEVNKKSKVKIRRIEIEGNEILSDRALRKALKETKEKSYFNPFQGLAKFLVNFAKQGVVEQNSDTLPEMFLNHFSERVKIKIFKSSKFLHENFREDKKLLLSKYYAKGYRDARIVEDSLIRIDEDEIAISMKMDEGNRYYFRKVDWIGNVKYPTAELDRILGVKNGDVYNPEILESRLFMNPNGLDVSSLYMDNGYLFFQLTPVETKVENDSIDLEIRIYEGQQARINRILIKGNSKTHEHVIRREIRTRPGDLFNRSDIIRTQRELSILGYFDPEGMNVNPRPNPDDGTVDIEYEVSERPSDQIELSGGFGAGMVIGTLGVSFTNFSTRNFFKKGAWKPLPSGDGQRLSVRAQTNGIWFQSYSFSFTEPWLGGKRPNALSLSTYYSIQSNGRQRSDDSRQSIDIFGVSLGLGKRLRWPDDNFQLYQEISFQNYNVQNWLTFQNFNQGHANNIFYKFVFSRSSVDDLNYPKSGSQTTLSGQFTPPYSWFNNKDYLNIDSRERFKFIEYNKWKFTSAWYTPLIGKSVLYTKVGFGGMFRYSNVVGDSPFERFYLGGSGLTGFALDAREIIALRGYDDQSVSNEGRAGNAANLGGTIINKYTMEFRYPFSLNPQAMIYGLTFLEAGNTWRNLDSYNPFNVYRSAGVGVRVFLPMFGLLGLDWGYRFDDIPGAANMRKSQIHFTIGANLGEL